MADTLANIIAGPIKVYEAPLDEPLPEIDDLTPPSITVVPAGNWVANGFSMEDGVHEYTPNYTDVPVNEADAAVTAFLNSVESTVTYMDAEDDLTALERGMSASTLTTVAAGADQTGQEILGVGGSTSTITLKSLLIVCTNPAGGTRLIHCFRALITAPSTWTRGREHKGRGVTYKLYTDPAKTDNQRLFRHYDILAPASS